MTKEFEEKLANAGGSAERKKVLIEILQVIQSPEGAVGDPTASFERVRFILPICEKTANLTSGFDPTLSEPVCYLNGLTSPVCIQAIRRYEMTRKKAINPIGKPNNPSIIGTF